VCLEPSEDVLGQMRGEILYARCKQGARHRFQPCRSRGRRYSMRRWSFTVACLNSIFAARAKTRPSSIWATNSWLFRRAASSPPDDGQAVISTRGQSRRAGLTRDKARGAVPKSKCVIGVLTVPLIGAQGSLVRILLGDPGCLSRWIGCSKKDNKIFV
jgi:hypothetical protein